MAAGFLRRWEWRDSRPTAIYFQDLSHAPPVAFGLVVHRHGVQDHTAATAAAGRGQRRCAVCAHSDAVNADKFESIPALLWADLLPHFRCSQKNAELQKVQDPVAC